MFTFQEHEPNNTYDKANGPIYSGSIWQGKHNDQFDFYTFYADLPGSINITLTSEHDAALSSLAIQVALYSEYQSSETRRGFAVVPPYTIFYNGNPGWYFVRVFTDERELDSNESYFLTFSIPQVTLTPSNISNAKPTFISTPTVSPKLTTTTFRSPEIPRSATLGYYNFETGTQNWVTSESDFKLVTLTITTQVAYSGTQSLQLNPNLSGDASDIYRHTEAVAYFNSAILENIDSSGPYNLTRKLVSCFVYLPSELGLRENPQAYIRLFVKDTNFRNQFSNAIDIVPSNVNQWLPLTLSVGASGNSIDPEFDSTQVNALGIRIELFENATLNYIGPLYVDLCSVEYP